jgi:DNA-binding MarR family transcriptional regulator
MPRADPERLAVWQSFITAHSLIDRRLTLALNDERELPLTWFQVLNALQISGGKVRVMDLAEHLVASASSLSRQINRMEEEGLVRRDRGRVDDQRAVVVALTKDGRDTWRRANTTYLRVVKRHFLAKLADSDVVSMQRVFGKVLDTL